MKQSLYKSVQWQSRAILGINNVRLERGLGREVDLFDSWNFYTWYMDRNRPLSPGTKYDKFRQKDFERRKAEGFPPPMYLSHIPIPEATAEQQAEREKYWRDVDYMVP